MGKHRIYEIAKEIGVDSKKVLSFLANRKIDVKNHMSTVEDSVHDLIIKEMGPNRKQNQNARPAATPVSQTPKANVPPAAAPVHQDTKPSAPQNAAGSKPAEQRSAEPTQERKPSTGSGSSMPKIIIHRNNPSKPYGQSQNGSNRPYS